MIARFLLLALLVGAAGGCANNADTNAPQVERSGAPHPPGAEPGAKRPQ